jgi:hypothetical protein
MTPPGATVGDALPVLTFHPTVAKIVLSPAFTKDAYPGHHDVDLIRSLGHPTIFLNTMTILGLMDRLVTDWCGPDSFVTRHTLRLLRPAYAQRTLTVSGEITSVGAAQETPAHSVEAGLTRTIMIAVTIADGEGTCSAGEVTVALP